jgi:hypothetical protein
MFTQDKLPKYSSSQIEPSDRKHAIDYDIDIGAGLQSGSSPMADIVYCNSRIEKTIIESGVFEKIYQGVGNEKYHMSIKLESQISLGAINFINVLLHGLTLMVVPYYTPVNYVLTVDVSKEGNIIKTYKYEDGYSRLVQLFLMFYPDFRSYNEMQAEVMNNMARNFLFDLQKDEILR